MCTHQELHPQQPRTLLVGNFFETCLHYAERLFPGRFPNFVERPCIFVQSDLPSIFMNDWDDLRFFLAVARCGSLSSAARELGVSQPTVGRRIANFEHKLGATLFSTTPTGQQLSAIGQRLLTHAKGMESNALAVELLASGRDAGLSGLVRITANDWLVERALASLLGPLLLDHPGLEIELLADPHHLNLTRREAEIALRPSRFEHQELVEILVGSISFEWYASDSYLTRHGTPDFSNQCEGHTLIVMSEMLKKIPDLGWLPHFASRARVGARANARLPMAMLAVSGVGLACLPAFLGDSMPSLCRIPTPIPGPKRKLWMAAHRDARSVPRIQTTLAFLKENFARIGPALCPER
jgi:DNA-binding transcriptional LysR family regulator